MPKYTKKQMPGSYQVKVRWNKRAASLVPPHAAKRPKRTLPEWANSTLRRAKRVGTLARSAQNEAIDVAEVDNLRSPQMSKEEDEETIDIEEISEDESSLVPASQHRNSVIKKSKICRPVDGHVDVSPSVSAPHLVDPSLPNATQVIHRPVAVYAQPQFGSQRVFSAQHGNYVNQDAILASQLGLHDPYTAATQSTAQLPHNSTLANHSQYSQSFAMQRSNPSEMVLSMSGQGNVFAPAFNQMQSHLGIPSSNDVYSSVMASQMFNQSWNSLGGFYGTQQWSMPLRNFAASSLSLHTPAAQNYLLTGGHLNRIEETETNKKGENSSREKIKKLKLRVRDQKMQIETLMSLLPTTSSLAPSDPASQTYSDAPQQPVADEPPLARPESPEIPEILKLLNNGDFGDKKWPKLEINNDETEEHSIQAMKIPWPYIFSFLPKNEQGIRYPTLKTVSEVCPNWKKHVLTGFQYKKEEFGKKAISSRTEVRHLLISQMGTGLVVHAAMCVAPDYSPNSTLAIVKCFGIEDDFELKEVAYHDSPQAIQRDGVDRSRLISAVGRRWHSNVLKKMFEKLRKSDPLEPSKTTLTELFCYLIEFFSFYTTSEIILDDVALREDFVTRLADVLEYFEIKPKRINFDCDHVYDRYGRRNRHSCGEDSLVRLLRMTEHVNYLCPSLINNSFLEKLVKGLTVNDYTSLYVNYGENNRELSLEYFNRIDCFSSMSFCSRFLNVLEAAKKYIDDHINVPQDRSKQRKWVINLVENDSALTTIMDSGLPTGWSIEAPFQAASINTHTLKSSPNPPHATIKLARDVNGRYKTTTNFYTI